MRRRFAFIAAVVLVLGAAGAGLAIAGGAGDDDEPLTGVVLERATAAALEHTGGGTVIETEVGDDGAAYGIEVRLDDGRVVEVALDESFEVVGQEYDDDTAGEEEDGEDE
jgi:hypothetical protein